MDSRNFRACAIVQSLVFALSAAQTTRAQTPPTFDQFENGIRACIVSQHITLSADVVNSIVKLYGDQGASGVLSSSDQFLQYVPDQSRLEAYRLYVDCIKKILSQDTSITSSPVTVVYRVCSGEYERACQQHDAYFYCYADIAAWANARCGSYKISRLNTYGGNKCGYALDAVICTGPK